MDRLNLTRIFKKYDCEPISAQTVPNTYSFITYSSLCAEQVNNRSSAQWKKANFIVCSKEGRYSLRTCIEGWKLLAASTQDQVLFLQEENGLYKAYNWAGRELNGSIEDIVKQYCIYEYE